MAGIVFDIADGWSPCLIKNCLADRVLSNDILCFLNLLLLSHQIERHRQKICMSVCVIGFILKPESDIFVLWN